MFPCIFIIRDTDINIRILKKRKKETHHIEIRWVTRNKNKNSNVGVSPPTNISINPFKNVKICNLLIIN